MCDARDACDAPPLADRLCMEARTSSAPHEDCAAMDRLSCLLVQCDDMGLAGTAFDEAIGLANGSAERTSCSMRSASNAMPVASFLTPPLRAAGFTATAFHDAAAKATFGNQLLAFIAEDFPRRRFTQSFYRVLCQHFGMIAHYDVHGFWAEYFTTTADKLRFLEALVAHPCWGDPAFTFSDLERAVIRRLRDAGLVARFRATLLRETEAAERALLNRLQARYQPQTPPVRVPSLPAVADWASDQPSLL